MITNLIRVVIGVALMGLIGGCKEIELDREKWRRYAFNIGNDVIELRVPPPERVVGQRRVNYEASDIRTGVGTKLLEFAYEIPRTNYLLGNYQVELWAVRFPEDVDSYATGTDWLASFNEKYLSERKEKCQAPTVCDEMDSTITKLTISDREWLMTRSWGGSLMHHHYELAVGNNYYLRFIFTYNKDRFENDKWRAVAEEATQAILENVTIMKETR